MAGFNSKSSVSLLNLSQSNFSYIDALEALGVNVREKLPKLNQIVRELALAGISKDEIIENVNKVYEEIE